MAEEKRIVCVTGDGGFVASWLIKLLLSRGYFVHATLRNPWDEKNAHLKKLEGESENLQLFKADLLNYHSLCAAISGCDSVFHVASPVPSTTLPNPEAKYIEVETKPMNTSEKLQKLGWSYRGLEETLVNSVESYKLHGLVE